MTNIIIHISGPNASGKTKLGERFKNLYEKYIKVKDLDTLRDKFLMKRKCYNKFDKVSYQKYIDKYIEHHSNKPLIFVGLNTMPWWHLGHYYNVHAKYKFFIKIDDDINLEYKCKRLLMDLAHSKEDMEVLVNENKKYIENVVSAIKRELNLDNIVKENNMFRRDYKKQGYIFLTSDKIEEEVRQILDKY